MYEFDKEGYLKDAGNRADFINNTLSTGRVSAFCDSVCAYSLSYDAPKVSELLDSISDRTDDPPLSWVLEVLDAMGLRMEVQPKDAKRRSSGRW